MKQEKYVISIKREALRCSLKGKKSTKAFPKAFGNKEKNIFISCDDENEAILKLKVSTSNHKNAYIKMQEITNVVVNELHSLNEMIYSSYFYDNVMIKRCKITFKID